MSVSILKGAPDGSGHRSRLAVVLVQDRLNRGSCLALAGALEVRPEASSVPIHWVTSGRKFFETLDELTELHEFLIVCRSYMTFQKFRIREELNRLALNPARSRMFLLAGGPHPSGDPRNTLREGFDGVCPGEGEAPLAGLVLAMLQNRDIEEVPGFYLRNGGEPLFTGRCVAPDWNVFPSLPYRLKKYGAIEISRGCPYRCRYCQTPVLKGRRVRHKRPESIFRAVEYLVDGDRNDVRFITPNALGYGSPDGKKINLLAVGDLLEGIRKRLPAHGRIFFGSFPSEVRPEFITEESVALMSDLCDNRMIVFGAQSGNEEMLRRMNRGHSTQAVRRAGEILLAHGFAPVVDFMIGLPGESLEAMCDSVNFMEELSGMGVRVHLHTFMPLPGSPWAALAPVPIPDGIRRRLHRLSASGRLFGQWGRQERLVSGMYSK